MTASASTKDSAASRSLARNASVDLATPSATKANSCTTFWSISSRSRWNPTRVSSAISTASSCSSEAPGDVVLGSAVVGLGEDLGRRPHLDEPPGLAGAGDVEEGRDVAHARRLLHVVGDDDDRVAVLEVADEVLDPKGGDGVEGRAGLVHQQHLGLHGDGPGNAQALLLTTGEAGPGPTKAVGNLVPEAGQAQRSLHHVVELTLLAD